MSLFDPEHEHFGHDHGVDVSGDRESPAAGPGVN